MKKKTLVMLSGGIDSATAVAIYHQKGDYIEAVYFNVGQENWKRELSAARKVANHYKIPLEVIDLQGLAESFLGLSEGINIGVGFTALVNEKGMNCPHALFGLATTFGVLKGFNTVVNGINLIDYSNELSIKNYVKKYSALIMEFEKGNIQFETPFLEIHKKDIVKMAKELNVPISLTRSCVRNFDQHCGECMACKERKDAFMRAEIEDSVRYLKD